MASLNSVPFCLDIDKKKDFICTDMWTTELNESVKFILAWVLLSFVPQALSNTQVRDSLAIVSSCLGTYWLTLQPPRMVPHLNSMSFFHWIFLAKVGLREPTLCFFLYHQIGWKEKAGSLVIFALILSELWAKRYLSQGLTKVENLNLLHAAKTCALPPWKSRHGYERHTVTKDIHQNLVKGEETTCLSISLNVLTLL